MNATDDDLPADPAESLRLIEREQAAAERQLTPDPRVFFWPWGFAWLLGFALFFLRFGPDGRVFVDLPAWLPLTALFVLMFGAGVVTAVMGVRSGRDISGVSARQGMLYGITWSVAFSGMSLVLSQVTELLPESHSILLWSGVMVALVGALYMAGGAIYDDRAMVAVGVWTSAVNVAGVLAGPGWHALLLSVLAGGGMIAAGSITRRRLRLRAFAR